MKQQQSIAQAGFRTGFVGDVLIARVMIAAKASRGIGRIFF
jgi:hypothetical protein